MLTVFFPARSVVFSGRYTPETNGPCISGASFLTGSEFEYRRSMVVLCKLCRIRCNPMHPLYGALPGSYVPVRITPDALVAHRYTYAPPRCSTTHCRRTFIPLSVSLWNDPGDPVFDGVGLAGF